MISVYFRKSPELSMAVIFVVDALTDVAYRSRYLRGMGKEGLYEALRYHLLTVDFDIVVVMHFHNNLRQGSGILAGSQLPYVIGQPFHIIYIVRQRGLRDLRSLIDISLLRHLFYIFVAIEVLRGLCGIGKYLVVTTADIEYNICFIVHRWCHNEWFVNVL